MTEDSPSARFTDGKEPGALRTIGEVANALGIRQHVLRYWEQQFPMLKPLKRSGGRRYYRPEDVALVERIDRLVNQQGYTLRGARQAIEGGAAEAVVPVAAVSETPPAAVVATPPVAEPIAAISSVPQSADPQPSAAELLQQLRALRARLAEALDA